MEKIAPIAYLSLATLFSGLTFFLVKIVTTKIYPILGNLFSLLAALSVLLVIFGFLKFRGTPMPLSRDGVSLSLVTGVFVALYTFFLFLSFSKLDVSKATPVLYIGSLVIATVLSVIFLKEKLNIYNVAGFILAALSILLILWK